MASLDSLWCFIDSFSGKSHAMVEDLMRVSLGLTKSEYLSLVKVLQVAAAGW